MEGVSIVIVTVALSSLFVAQSTFACKVPAATSIECNRENASYDCEQSNLLLIAEYDNKSTSLCAPLDDLQSAMLNTSSILNISSIKVMFCSSEYNLTFNLVLESVHHVQLIGSPSVLSCSYNAGITVLNSRNISIQDMTLERCGVIHNSTTQDNHSTFLQFQSAVYVHNSSTITLNRVKVTNSNGTGVSFFDTNGTVVMKNCTFENNSVDEKYRDTLPGGGGVYLELNCLHHTAEHCIKTDCIKTDSSYYHFEQCRFVGNTATSIKRSRTDFAIDKGSKFHGLGRGGGLNVMYRGAAAYNRVVLSRCQFNNNSAIWGGGLMVTFLDEVYNNSFAAQECVFEGNMCEKYAGGGADVGFTYFSQPYPHGNKMEFSKCLFTDNTAKTGGGLAIYSSGGAVKELNNSIYLEGCSWIHNKAHFGSAVDISTHAWTTIASGYLPTPKFRDSVFFENYVLHNANYSEIFSFYTKGKGTFLSTKFNIDFFGTLNFTSNNGSALALISSVAVFQTNTNVVFYNNSGLNGGAISLIGFSSLMLNESMSLILSNNHATKCGGAIYSYSIDKHNYVSSRSCFIHNTKVYGQGDRTIRNTTVMFVNNSAETFSSDNSIPCGHSVYATTLLPCYHACTRNALATHISLEETFTCFGNFTFTNSDRDYELTTSGAKFVFGVKEPVKLIPNKKEKIPVQLLDDLEQPVNSEIYLDITDTNEMEHQVKLEQSYAYIAANSTVVYGQPQDSSYLTLSTTSLRENVITFKFEVQECPPGFVNIESKCTCSVGTTDHFYNPVYSCDYDEFVAKARHSYWIGYVDGETEDHLTYSYCQNKRCFQHLKYQHLHKLTNIASKDLLDRLVCGNETTGVLCGTCRKGYHATYHNSGEFCSNKSCRFGWLFYITSELLPITLLFIIVIAFNINFAKGELNGFVFFAQMFNVVSISAVGSISIPKSPTMALKIARLLYQFFNFGFFRINELSFCLWEGASTLDMIAFEYVTMAYALLLILATIWLMNKCNLYQKIYCLRASTMRTSITHGLSAFLIMVYAQCAAVSFKILNYTTLHTKGHKYNRTVVTYQGDIQYFHPRHLPYAIPALVCVLVILLTPAIVLLLYPSFFRLTTFLKLDENRCVSRLLPNIPHSLIKPFADSFQSSFKDNYRFFAGLYFMYRLALLSSWFMPNLMTQRLMLLEFLFVTMSLIHSLFQPYKKRCHNVIDSLVFFNLSIINGITVYNYQYTKVHMAEKVGMSYFIHVQTFLVYLPLVCFTIYMMICVFNKVGNFCKVKSLAISFRLKLLMETNNSEEELPARLLDEETSQGVEDYHLYEVQTRVSATY